VTSDALPVVAGAAIAALAAGSLVAHNRALRHGRGHTQAAVTATVLCAAGLMLAAAPLLPTWTSWLALAVIAATSVWFLVSQLWRLLRDQR
jgi:hypothetical protein